MDSILNICLGKFNFISCSWDFCKTAFYPTDNKAIIRAYFSHCHFERGEDIEHELPLIIGNEISQYSWLQFYGSDITDKYNAKTFYDSVYDVSGTLSYNMEKELTLENLFVVPDNVFSNIDLLHYGTNKLPSKTKMLNYDCLFSQLSDTNINTTSTDYLQLENCPYQIKCSQNLQSYSIQEKPDSSLGKEIVFNRSQSGNTTVAIKTTVANVGSSNKLRVAWAHKNSNGGTRANIVFYDITNNVIGTKTSYMPEQSGEDYSFITKSTNVNIPSGTYKMDIEFVKTGVNQTEYIGGVFVWKDV